MYRTTQAIPAEVLIEAYARGCFPMADPATGEIGWYTADPRAVLPLYPFHVPRRLLRALKSSGYAYTTDRCFEQVMRGCADREESWISESLLRSYVRLHLLGVAHSVEVWREDRLVGGLYGVHLGGAFFGESMFHREPGASKAALVHLAGHLEQRGFQLLEIQMITPLTSQFGARHVSREEYFPMLEDALAQRCEW